MNRSENYLYKIVLPVWSTGDMVTRFGDWWTHTGSSIRCKQQWKQAWASTWMFWHKHKSLLVG